MVTRRRAGRIERATRAELVALGRLESEVGARALKLAERLDAAPPDEPGSALAALSKELRATMVEARASGSVAADPVDELAARRRERLASGT